MLPVPLSFCVQSDALTGGEEGNYVGTYIIVDVEAAPFHGLIIAYGIMHYKHLSAYSCVIWFVPLQCMSVQILLCEKIKISVTNMQTDNSKV